MSQQDIWKIFSLETSQKHDREKPYDFGEENCFSVMQLLLILCVVMLHFKV